MPKLGFACTWGQRVRGLLGKHANGETLLLAPCHDIHTVGMEYPIDVAFVDERGRVVESHREVSPGNRLKCRDACAVLERRSCEFAWYRVGETLELVSPAAVIPLGKPLTHGGGRVADGDGSVANGDGIVTNGDRRGGWR